MPSTRLRLISDHGELHAERRQDGAHGFIARMGATAESLVKALTAEAGILSDPSHVCSLYVQNAKRQRAATAATAAERQTPG